MLRCAATAVAAAVLGCAEIGRPPGGPIDTTPPAVVSASPDSLETGVNPAAPVTVTFSEKVDKNSVRDWFFLTPYRRIEAMDWDGPAVTVRFRDGLPRDSTVSVVIGSGVLDRDGNRIAAPFRRTFSTGSSVAPGTVAGTIRRTRIEGGTQQGSTGAGGSNPGRPAGPAVFVWLYRALADTLPDFTRDDPDFLAEAGSDGRFVLDGLPLDVPLLAVTVNDADRSRDYSDTRDYLTVQADTLRLSAASPGAATVFYLIDPKSPGQISGSLEALADTTVVDTLSYGVILCEEAPDGSEFSWPPLKLAGSAMVRNGAFTIARVPPGRYRVGAFADLDGNGSWTLTDRLGDPLPVRVEPSAETGGVLLRRPAGRREN